jgi:hypothetical protein
MQSEVQESQLEKKLRILLHLMWDNTNSKISLTYVI